MNKKILFLFLTLAIIFPAVSFAGCGCASTVCEYVCNVKGGIVDVGAIFLVIGWVVAGGLLITSGGDAGKLGTAKKAIFFMLAGTAILILASTAYTFVQGALGL